MIRVKIHPDVAAGLSGPAPVVALESTIITHGMPFPENLETALAVESEVRRWGGIPATIGVVDGIPVVGLTRGEIEHLAKIRGAMKISRRDLALVVARRESGGTTVSGTMILANRCGIRFFATGGIGGVHRGAESTFDVSTDLFELGRTPVAVFSSGAKAILDLPKTLECLESMGVPVIGFRTDQFPAFYYAESGLPVPHRSDSPEEVARILRAHEDLGIMGGVLVANPIPKEHALPGGLVESAIHQAFEAAESQKIRGAALTPFLLSELEKITGGLTLKANVALVMNNARLATQVARAFQGLS